MTTAGTKQVTVTYTENEVTKTASYNITVNELPVVNLKIRVYGVQMEYMRMLPLHQSQSEMESRLGEFAVFTYRVCLTPELKSKILAMGPDVEVLEPLEYREEIKNAISLTLNKY